MVTVRGTEWKYIRYFSKENDRKKYLPDASIEGEQPIYEELFNIKDDPNEQIDLTETNLNHSVEAKDVFFMPHDVPSIGRVAGPYFPITEILDGVLLIESPSDLIVRVKRTNISD